MDFKLFATTFAFVFLAELGDKTQLAVFGLSASAPSRFAVFLGAASALVLTTALAVLLGDTIGRVVPEIWLKRGAGVVFLVMGVVFLLGYD